MAGERWNDQPERNRIGCPIWTSNSNDGQGKIGSIPSYAAHPVSTLRFAPHLQKARSVC
jgi:hypothetical protein